MKNKKNIIRACEKCGKPQPKNKKESNRNWNVYDSNILCECGGKFGFMYLFEAERLKNND